MAASISVTETTDSKESSVCQICFKKEGRYTCPRCNQRYCSVECYRGNAHADCSEEFYKECVTEELQDVRAKAEDRHKILEMLSRLEDEHSPLDSDDDDDDLADRLEGLDLDVDSDEIWSRLTDKEKQEFKSMIDNGCLGNMIAIWQPWWRIKKSPVEELEESPKSAQSVPPVKENIPDIQSLLKTKPASSVVYDAINILYCYACVARSFNGDHLQLPTQAIEMMLQLCLCLQGKMSFSSCSEALHSGRLSAQQSAKRKDNSQHSEEFLISLIEDVKYILEGPDKTISTNYVLSALSDLQRIIVEARCKTDQAKKLAISNKAPKLKIDAFKKRKQILFQAEKKMDFLLAWTKSYSCELGHCLASIELEFSVLSTELAVQKSSEEKLQSSSAWDRPQNKKLIVEI